QTREFNIDTSNFGPRVGVAWSVDQKTVLRASTGIMYDQPILGGYEQALQLSGSPRSPIYSFSGTSAGAPAFPNGASTGTIAQQSPGPSIRTSRSHTPGRRTRSSSGR